MKSIIRVSNMRSAKDVGSIRMALGNLEGIMACQIKLDKREIDIVYDRYFISIEEIYDLLEDMGYTTV